MNYQIKTDTVIKSMRKSHEFRTIIYSFLLVIMLIVEIGFPILKFYGLFYSLPTMLISGPAIFLSVLCLFGICKSIHDYSMLDEIGIERMAYVCKNVDREDVSDLLRAINLENRNYITVSEYLMYIDHNEDDTVSVREFLKDHVWDAHRN